MTKDLIAFLDLPTVNVVDTYFGYSSYSGCVDLRLGTSAKSVFYQNKDIFPRKHVQTICWITSFVSYFERKRKLQWTRSGI